jgi:hypothetical protein
LPWEESPVSAAVLGVRVEPRTTRRRDVKAAGGGDRALDALEKHPGRRLDHVIDRLAHGGEVVGRPARLRHVVESDDGDVLRHPEAELEADDVHDGERHLVVAGEDGVGPLGGGPIEEVEGGARAC